MKKENGVVYLEPEDCAILADDLEECGLPIAAQSWFRDYCLGKDVRVDIWEFQLRMYASRGNAWHASRVAAMILNEWSRLAEH